MLAMANFALSMAMLSLILVIQLVHYPSFDFYAEATFTHGMQTHQRRISFIVIPLMLTEAIVALTMAVQHPSALTWLTLALLSAVWLLTLKLQVPLHQQLLAGKDAARVRLLVKGNWWRVGAWALKAVLATMLVISQ